MIFLKSTKIGNMVYIKSKILSIVGNDLKILLKKRAFLQILFSGLFLALLLNNLLGLIVYIFSTTRHLRITLTLRMIIWIRLFLVNIIFNTKRFLSHLVPENISYALTPLIVLIESLSNLIRPFILGIRIRANIIAGHLLMTLVREILGRLRRIGFIITSLGIVLLIILERIVRIIQAYIFTILIGLYFSE